MRRCCTTTCSPRASTPAPTKPSNIAKRIDVQEGRRRRRASPRPRSSIEKRLHHAGRPPGLYRAACLRWRAPARTARSQVWSTTQGHFLVRGFCAKLLSIDTSQIRVTPTEIGGGFGGKTVVYLEPLAIKLSQKSGKPVKMAMTPRGGVPRLRPGPGRHRQGQDRRQEGRHASSPPNARSRCRPAPSRARRSDRPACARFACYDIANIHIVGYDVVSNRPRSRPIARPARRSRRSPSKSTLDILALQARMDPIDLRLKNAAKKGTKTAYGVTLNTIGLSRRWKPSRTPALQDAAEAGLCARHRGGLLVQRRRRTPVPRRTSTRTARSP